MNPRPLTRRSLIAASAAGIALAGSATLIDALPAAATEQATVELYPLKPPHLLEAENLVEYLRLRSNPWSWNKYDTPAENFGNTSVVWGRPGHPEEFSNLSQCASFLTAVLERAYGPDTAYGWATSGYFTTYVPPRNGGTRTVPYPDAEDFVSAFLNASNVPHIDPVTKPVNLRPGDLVAIDYDPAAKTVPYTGHIVMIRSCEGTFPSGVDSQLGGGVVPYLFQIVDCTSAPHGGPDLSSGTSVAHYRTYPDTRADISDDNSQYIEHSGAGYGHMIFYADPATTLFAGYRWSVNSSAVVRATGAAQLGTQQIAAGRVNAFTI